MLVPGDRGVLPAQVHGRGGDPEVQDARVLRFMDEAKAEEVRGVQGPKLEIGDVYAARARLKDGGSPGETQAIGVWKENVTGTERRRCLYMLLDAIC